MTELNIKLRRVDSIRPYDLNAKVHDPQQVKKIAQSIREFGWTQPIVVDANGVIIAGHGRRLAAISLGLEEVPVLVRDDLSEDEVRALRLADNRVAISGMDSDKLQAELSSLNFDLEGIFDKKELAFLEADLAIVDDTKFITDIEAAVRQQTAETAQKVADIDEKEVPIAKVVGFKSIKTKDEKYVAAFMAQIEEETGLKGAEAFIEFSKNYGGG